MQRSRKVIEEHYDLSNELYFSFLDPYNQYTCGYFKNTENLAEAQQFKLNLICRKLKLTAQDTLLDIGCGWGGLAEFAAEQYGCAVAGLTTSREQARYARDFVKGLPVEIIEADYREWSKSGKKYTKIATVGMIEHVGHKNYQTFFNEVSSLLSPSGLFLLHTIGGHVSQTHGDIWSHKYIFPNGMVPSLAQIGLASEGLFIFEDMQNFGPYYDKTLMAWEENFRKNWPSIQSAYSEKFYRMWRYYFLSFAGSFRARRLDLWQLVFSKEWDSRGIYQAER